MVEIICNNFYVLFGEGYNSLYYNSYFAMKGI